MGENLKNECNQLRNDVEAIGKALADVILFLAIKEEEVPLG